jgi:flagellar basal body rod protein FlgG
MNYALQLSASGVLTSMYRQDVLANNLANVETVAFRPDIAATRQRDAATQEDALFNMPSNRLLERLGAGVLLEPNRVSTSQGAIEKTGNPLDLAIEGRGFFVVSSGAGNDARRLTRDGRLTLNADGTLVQAGSGCPVLDSSGDRIRIDAAAGPVEVDDDGAIRQGDAVVGSIQFVDVPDPSSLQKLGNGHFLADPASELSPAPGRVHARAVEGSGVDPIQAIMGITDAAQDIANNAKLIQISDELMGRLIRSVGRVS